MTTVALPLELQKYNHLRFLKKRGRNEWSSECPVCSDSGHRSGSGTPDRWRMFANGHQGRDARGFCRQCGFFEFAKNRTKQLSAIELLAIEQERKRLAKEERARMQIKIARLQEQAYWKGWHDAMTADHRKLWAQEGINEAYQDWFELGFDPERKFYYDDKIYTSPAMTIPYFQPAKAKRQKQIATVQFRLLEPIDPGDKYRFMKDLSAPLYLPDPRRKPYGRCLLVEGGKKGMVAHMWLRQYFDSVAAVPGKMMAFHNVEELADCELVYVVFDPDANYNGQSERAAKLIGKDRTRIGSLPAKIDDMIVKYGASHKDVWEYIRLARPA